MSAPTHWPARGFAAEVSVLTGEKSPVVIVAPTMQGLRQRLLEFAGLLLKEDRTKDVVLSEALRYAEDADIAATICAQRDELLAAVKAFCAGSSWVAAEWKAQAHIKPLFDLAAKAEGGQP